MGLQYLTTAEDLARFADEHGLRRDWHEPDEQSIGAYVVGKRLDNAYGAYGCARAANADDFEVTELRVVLTVAETPHAVANLADLLAWASRPHRVATR